MAESLLERLRHDIVSGRLTPGSPLRQDEIARSLGVSPVPIRETFLRLQAEGLVEIRPRRGAIVSDLSAAEIEELNEMRTALESLALRKAMPNITDADLRKAQTLLDLIDRRPESWVELNAAFHSIIYKPAARPRLLNAILSLQLNVERYLHREVEVTNNVASSQREHRRLLALIKKGKTEEACSLLSAHILEPGRILVSELRKSGRT
ncbi:MAG TPA: GntR family transcriptional regulator [Candidatus Tumulicola sp.]|jgi:DNA-binding GntR family transcriptional regulator